MNYSLTELIAIAAWQNDWTKVQVMKAAYSRTWYRHNSLDFRNSKTSLRTELEWLVKNPIVYYK